MFFGQGLGILGETAEIASSAIAEDYPKTSLLANVVTRLLFPEQERHVDQRPIRDKKLYWKSYSSARGVV